MQNKNWIFLRGLVRGKNHWADFPKKFLATFPQSQIQFLEIPGNGEACQQITPDQIDLIVDELRKQKITKSHVLSMSLGSMVALNWKSRFPEDIEQLFCINTSSRLSPFYRRMQIKALLRLLTSLVPLMTSAKNNFRRRESIILDVTLNALNDQGVSDEKKIASEKFAVLEPYIELFTQEAMKHPVQVKNALRQLRAAASFSPPEAQSLLSPELHFLASRKDRLVNSLCSQDLANHYGCSLDFHPWAGHDLPLDDADWVIKKMSLYL